MKKIFINFLKGLQYRFFGLVLGLLLFIIFHDEDEVRRPIVKAATIEMRKSPSDTLPPTTIRKTNPQGNTSGTAFSIDKSGNWLTAHHVVDGCKQVFVASTLGKHGKERVIKVKQGYTMAFEVNSITKATNVDMAILHTGYSAKKPLKLSTVSSYNSGFAVGFPQGSPGELASTYLGKSTSHTTLDGKRIRQQLLVWSIYEKTPEYVEPGGISGGPMLDEKGQVLGINTAGPRPGNPSRRGRISTSTPETMVDFLQTVRVTPNFNDLWKNNLNKNNYNEFADKLRDQYTVSFVLCVR